MRKTLRSLEEFRYSNSERSEQFLVTNAFLTCSWRFLLSNKLEQLEFNNSYYHNFYIAEDENFNQAHEKMNWFDTVLIESNEESEEKTEMKSEISDPLALNEPMIENQEMIFDSSDTETSNNQNYDSTVIREENHQTSVVESSNV